MDEVEPLLAEGDAKLEAGAVDAAVAAYTSAWQRLVGTARTHESRRLQGRVAARLGRVAHRAGRFDEARLWFERDLEITTALVAERPDWTADLASSLGNAGNAALAAGDHGGARQCFEESLDLCRRLDRREHTHDLSAALSDLGRLARAESRHAEAQALFEEDLALCRTLAEAHPGAESDHLLSIALNNVAACARANGRNREAREGYRASAAILRRLQSADRPDLVLALGATSWHLSTVVAPGRRREVLDDILALITPYVEAGVRPEEFGRLWDAARAARNDLRGP